MARLIWPRSSVKSESKSTSESNDITSASSPLRSTRSMKRLPASWIEPSMYCSLPEVSSNMASVMGRVTSLEKKAICCGWPSSATLKSSCFRSVTMRLLLSRTVTNRLTKLTCVRITGGCCDGSWGSAWRVVPAANPKATQTTRTFIAERMYNFLVQDTRSEVPAARSLTIVGCGEAWRGMRDSARRSCWKPQKVWPEDHEKSTKNSLCRYRGATWLRHVPRGANRRPTGACDRFHAEFLAADPAASACRATAQ